MKKIKGLVSIISTLLIINGCSMHKPIRRNINQPEIKKYHFGFGYKGTKIAAAYLFLAEQIQKEQYEPRINLKNKTTMIPNFNLDKFKIKLESESFSPLNLLRADFDYNTTIDEKEAKDYLTSLM